MSYHVRNDGTFIDQNVSLDHISRLLVQLNHRFVHAPTADLKTGQLLLVDETPDACGMYASGFSGIHIDKDSLATGEVRAGTLNALDLNVETINPLDDNVPLNVGGVSIGSNQVGTEDHPLHTLYVDNIVSKNPVYNNNQPVNEYEWILQEVQPSGVSAGNFPEKQWMVRHLNQEIRIGTLPDATESSEPRAILETGTYRFTLAPGRYDIKWRCPGLRCGMHRSALYDVTRGRFDGFGSNAMSRSNEMTYSDGHTNLMVSDATTYELQHYCDMTRQLDGLGEAMGIDGTDEMYATVHIRGRLTL
jgi:hypothetical protein